MSIKTFSAKSTQVDAIQLLIHADPDSDNAKEIADWCGGRAVWNYDSETGKRDVIVSYISNVNTLRVEETDWVVRDLNGTFYMLPDEEFQELFDTDVFYGPPTCQYCLSDPRHTPMGDPDEKRCPICGVRYSGPRRSKEFNVLVASGLVTKED